MIPVILSGGSGTRLWPLSRGQYPKQFLPLVAENTMLQETMLRLRGISGMQPVIAVCNEDHRFMLAEQLREIGVQPAAIILEPVGKNTAPAVTMAALAALSPDDVLLVLPADHVIAELEAFHLAIAEARNMAEQGYLVTFGILATAPETGYGYIKSGVAINDAALSVAAFVEKPDLLTAQKYLESGDYFWNSGMFAFKAGVYLHELQRFNPRMLEICREAFAAAKIDYDFVRLDKAVFAECPSDSIDYAVMEKTDKAVVIPLGAGWNDVGSWAALWDVASKDAEGNAIKGDVITVGASNSYLHSSSRLLVAIGIEELVVIETEDAVMVASKARVQDVKSVADKLRSMHREEAQIHRKVYRPWGYYDLVDHGDRHQTKRIVVKPGAKLSVQKHHHRAEHWVVVKGAAWVSRDGEGRLVTENESIYIPVGVVHSLQNPGVIALEMVEVQTGSYLGEDDIVRFEDQYGRT